MMMVGDFNVALTRLVDRERNTPINFHPPVLLKIYNLIDALELIFGDFKNPN